MASRIALVNALFDQLNSFLGQLTTMYPDDSDFPMFATTLKMLKTTNPMMVVKYLHDSITPFEEQILNKDEKFFLDYSFEIKISNRIQKRFYFKLKLCLFWS